MTEPLPRGLHPVAPGDLATVVTHLELRARPAPRPAPSLPLALRPVPSPASDWYRALFRRVGEDWLWQSRLAMEDGDLRAVLDDPAVAVFALDHEGREAGLLELDFREAPDAELAFFGVVPALQGTGAARWLMNEALRLAFERPLRRLRLHTCTLDHPRALDFYRRTGFRPVAQEVEVLRDPRHAGVLARNAAPHVPMFG
ncbi:GNAT family N-acetyltransferase [Jannaschia sp. W003]|uniref:GNAT family N-acetyltransferase n=1 Tax=Jannaschia sp. W003 TaxID=2867012 RepID=UPI0021A7A032|nr:GNAT family N-acetyltransferase [Jannaschia sp. W003]UWQ20220.1 GNAT family N-acetyltransferase [Jannaschia sp. W003]